MDSLADLLRQAGLQHYVESMRNVLRLRSANDIIYVDEKDLSSIGMTRPEQKRLKASYLQMYPKETIIDRFKKILGKSDVKKKEYLPDDQEQHVIPVERITLCKELGKGEFGSVFQAAWNNSTGSGIERIQVAVAVKCVPSEKLLAGRSNFLQEAAIMHRMRHECIVRLYGVVLDIKAVMLVSELAPCGSLLSCLQNIALRESLSVDKLFEYALQIATGMEYLSNQRLIHRDLAARNVLVFSINRVKISDFGLSRSLGMSEDYYRSDFSENLKLPIAWCAPESINFLRFTSASDVWSYGVTLFEIFSYGQVPWIGLTGAQVLSAIDYPHQQRLECPDNCPVDIYKLMLQCWTHNPNERPTFSKVVNSLPDLQPQILTTVCSCKDGVIDHLQYNKNETIVVLDKTPPAYPDGYYWRGCVKNGKTGLFRPDETVAKLDAENPSLKYSRDSLLTPPLIADEQHCVEKEKSKGKVKRQKLMISEPQGNLRHMCHIGVDGTCFGSLQGDKGDTIRIHPSAIKPFIPSVPICRSPSLPPLSVVEGSVRFSPLHSPDQHRNLRNDISFQDKNVKRSLSPKQKIPPIPVASKPIKSYSAIMQVIKDKNETCETFISESDMNLDSLANEEEILLTSLPRAKLNNPTSEKLMYFSSDVVTLPQKSNVNTITINTIQSDILNGHISEDLESPNVCEPVSMKSRGQSVCRIMSQNEFEKWEEKALHQHKKVGKELMDGQRKEELNRKNFLNKEHKNHDKNNSKIFSVEIQRSTIKNSFPENWTEDAQNAYKMLVQWGEDLKAGVNTSNDQFDTKNSPSSSTRSTITHYTRKLDKTESISPLRQLRNSSGNVAYDFRLGTLSSEKMLRAPPPVPPKPKKKIGSNPDVNLFDINESSRRSQPNLSENSFSTFNESVSAHGSFASTVAKSALLSRSMKDDIVMI